MSARSARVPGRRPGFGEVDLARVLLDDFHADPTADTIDLDVRLRSYLLHIGLDSIAYEVLYLTGMSGE